MHRSIVYDAEVPATLDVLNTGKNALVGVAFHNAAMFGPTVTIPQVFTPGTVIQGLAITPTVPTANMFINIAPGAVYQLDTVDATAYGDLGTDAAIITKQGILYTASALLVSPPTLTSGQSVNILVELQITDVDDTSTVVQYYNPSNPASPLWGSNFAATQALGTPQNTTRNNRCAIQLKNGTAATTGSQTTPATDSGFIGLYVITVPFGFTSIISTYLTSLQTGKSANGTEQARSLPYFPNLLAIPPDLQQSIWTYAVDTGSLNAMAAITYPLVTAYVAGLMCQVKAANTNTSTVTLNLNGLGAKAVHRSTGAALSAGDITSGELCWMIYDGTAWQLVNFPGAISSAQVNFFNSFSISYGVDHGTPNNLVVSPIPAISSLAAGQVVAVQVGPGNANTGATTITLIGLSAVSVVENELPLQNEAYIPGEIIILEYDGAVFQKQPQRWPYYPSTVMAAGATDQYLAINDLATISFNAVTSVPLNIASVPGVYDVELVVALNNSTKSDLWLLPNDTTGSGFQEFVSANMTSLSGETSGAVPKSKLVNDTAFPITMCLQASGGQDAGMFMVNMTVSTYTSAKFVRFLSGINGGASIGFIEWSDNSTLWTSLGTLLVSLSGTAMSPAATITGAVTVRRLA